MEKNEIFSLLINSCRKSGGVFQYIKKCVENPREYFKKKNLLNLFEQLNEEEKCVFDNTKILFKKTFDLGLKKIPEGFQSEDKCVICEKTLELQSFNNGFRFTCGSKECKNEYKKKIFLEKYGVENPSQSKEAREKFDITISKRTKETKESIKQKTSKTNLEKYGVENVFQAEIIKEKSKETKEQKYNDKNYNNPEKIKETKLEKYGDEHYNNQEKSQKTCFEKYGSVYYVKTNSFKEKSKETKLEKYGDEHYNNREKSKETKLEKYGDEHYNNREKSQKTCFEKYGVSNTNQLHLKNIDKIKDIDFIIENFTEGKCILKDKVMGYFNIKASSSYIYMIKNPLEKLGYKTKIKMDKSENAFLSDLESSMNITLLRQYKISNFKVDGFDPRTNTCYEFLGNYFHGNPEVFDLNKPVGKNSNILFQEKYDYTFWRFEQIKELGYIIKYIWEKDYKEKGLSALKEF